MSVLAPKCENNVILTQKYTTNRQHIALNRSILVVSDQEEYRCSRSPFKMFYNIDYIACAIFQKELLNLFRLGCVVASVAQLKGFALTLEAKLPKRVKSFLECVSSSVTRCGI